jgi:hypothetical protein
MREANRFPSSNDHSLLARLNKSFDQRDFIKMNPLNQTNEKWFINLSETVIPNEASNLLQFGSNFCMPHTNNKKSEIHEVIKDIESNISKFNIQHKADIRNIIVPQLQRFMDARTNNNVIDKKLISMFKYTTQFLKHNDNIIITRADKGNAVVAMDKEDYFQKMQSLLNDKDTYTLEKRDPTPKLEKTVNDLVKK